MRILVLASITTILAVAPLAQPERALALERVGLAVDLPDGYALQTACEIPSDFVPNEGQSVACDAVPPGESDELQTATYIFVDEPRHRIISVSVHNYFTEQSRGEWISGAGALENLTGTFTRVDPAQWTDRDAAAARWTNGPAAGVTLYGCEGWRCYRILLSGPAEDLDNDPGHYRTALAGVTFEPLDQPVRAGGHGG